MNARASENYLAISRSSSASKSVEIFWAEIYWGRLIFRAESSLIQSSCRSFIGVIVPYEISKVNFRVETKILVRLNKLKNKWLLLHTGSEFQWYQTYERGYETSGSPLRFMLRRSSLVECVSVLPGNRCLQNVEFFFLRQYVQPCLLKNPKYTFYTIKSSLKLAYNRLWMLQMSNFKFHLIFCCGMLYIECIFTSKVLWSSSWLCYPLW